MSGGSSLIYRAYCIYGLKSREGVIAVAVVSKNTYREDLATTGEKIRYWRKRGGYTQDALAERIGGNCTGKQVSYWENGTHEIGLQSFFMIAEALGVTPNDLAPGRLMETALTPQNPLYQKLGAADRENVDYMISRLYQAGQA